MTENIDPSQFLPVNKPDEELIEVTKLFQRRTKAWEVSLERKLTSYEIMFLNDGIWTGYKFAKGKRDEKV